jgi:hypothetical protein
MSKKEEKAESTMSLSMERIIKINIGLGILQEKDDLPLSLAFDIGIFKEEIEVFIKTYQKLLKGLEDKFYITVAKGVKTPDPEKLDELEKARQELLGKEFEGVKVIRFKLNDFLQSPDEDGKASDISIAPPKFFSLMGDLITK